MLLEDTDKFFDGFYFETLPMIRKVELGFVSPQFLLVWPPQEKVSKYKATERKEFEADQTA